MLAVVHVRCNSCSWPFPVTQWQWQTGNRAWRSANPIRTGLEFAESARFRQASFDGEVFVLELALPTKA
ncbi:hypothetical protein J6590_015123 [Homalodisca vitripennis]|nr:hypothetical protein J6590_015123 [Homalodisca vitripennis]